jgi:hypothetical protein
MKNLYLMTLGELTTAVRDILDESTASMYTDNNIKNWINAGERDIAVKTASIESVLPLQTTASSRLVSYTGNVVLAVELNTTSVREFLPGCHIPWQDSDDLFRRSFSGSAPLSTGADQWVTGDVLRGMKIGPHNLGSIPLRGLAYPQYWFVWGSYLVIEPTPDAIYDLNVYVASSPSDYLSAVGDSSSLPVEFQNLIVIYAVAMGLLRARKYAEAAIKYNEYMSLLRAMIDTNKKSLPSNIVDIRTKESGRAK